MIAAAASIDLVLICFCFLLPCVTLQFQTGDKPSIVFSNYFEHFYHFLTQIEIALNELFAT